MPTEPITLSGYVKGIGTLNNVLITGILSPGASPATVNYGSVEFGEAAQLVVEIGGKGAGEFDQTQLFRRGEAEWQTKTGVHQWLRARF